MDRTRSVAKTVQQICTCLTERLPIVAAFLLEGNRKRKTVFFPWEINGITITEQKIKIENSRRNLTR